MCIDTNYNICILSLGLLNFLHRQLTENLCYIAILELKGEIQTMVMQRLTHIEGMKSFSNVMVYNKNIQLQI